MVDPNSPARWRAWLEANHDRSSGVWLVQWKKASGRSKLTYDEAVTEALRVGWIDSKPNKLDADRSLLWYSPRQPGSAWAGPNKVRVAALEAADDLHPAGAAVIGAARADGSWTLLDDVEAGVLPSDLVDALAGAGLTAGWDALPMSVRKGLHWWMISARTDETRRRRRDEIVDGVRDGRRPGPYARG